MNKNTFEGSTNPVERNDQERSDHVAQPNPSVLATLIQETPMGVGAVTVDPADDLVSQDVPLDEKIPSNILPVEVTVKDAE